MKTIFRCTLILFTAVIAYSCKRSGPADAVPDPADTSLTATILTENLTNPWELVWGPDDELWMTERTGKVSTIDPGTGQVTSIITINDVKSMGEGGLLGMVLHPDFDTTPQVFLAYNYDNAGSYTEKVVRYTFNGTTLTDPVIILDNIPASSIHNGCRLLISADQKLFISTGDAANQPAAQDPASLSGKILRLNLDGSIPADNPDPQSAVWSKGHRNAQGLVFAKNRLYATEHGPDTDDEVNIIEEAGNFGWPNVKGLCNDANEQAFCTANAVEEPIYSWTPTIAVCGLDFYDNDRIPQWKNSLLMATLKDGTLYQLKLNEAGDDIESVNTFISEDYGRLRDVCVAPDGKVYVATSNGNNDKIVVISNGEADN